MASDLTSYEMGNFAQYAQSAGLQFSFDNIDEVIAGRDDEDAKALRAAIARTKAIEKSQLESWEELNTLLQPAGMRLVITETSRGGVGGATEYHASLVPLKAPASMVQGDLGKFLPKLHMSSIDKDKLVSLYGARTLNQGRIGLIEQAAAYAQANTEIINDIIKSLKRPGSNLSTWMREAEKHAIGTPEWERAMRRISSIVGYRGRSAWSGAISQPRQGAGTTLFEDLQNLGDKRSTAIRRGLTSVAPMMQDIVEEHKKDLFKAWRSKYGEKSRMDEDQVARDLWRVLSMYTQDLKTEIIDKQIEAMGQKKYVDTSYLINRTTQRWLSQYGRQIQALGVEIGTSPETAVDKMMVSLVRNVDLSLFGALDDPSNRKRYQTSQGLMRTKQAERAMKKALEEGYLFQKKAYTPYEKANGFQSVLGDSHQYGVMYASEQEINDAIERLRAQGKLSANFRLSSGAHSGGVYLANEVMSSLNSYMPRSASFSKAEYDAARAKVMASAGGRGKTGDELERLIQLALLNLPHGSYYSPSNQKKFDARWFQEPGREGYIINYLENRLMRNGTKVLGTEGYNIKGAGTSLARAIFDEVIAGRDISDAEKELLRKSSAMVQLEGKRTRRDFSGDFGMYVSGIFAQLNDDQMSTMLGAAGLSDWLVRKDGVWTANKAKFSRKQSDEDRRKELVDFVEGLHRGLASIGRTDLGQALKITGSGADAAVTIDYKRFFGTTGLQQWNGYQYGDPGQAINADYRLRGAVDRALVAAGMYSNSDMSVLSRVLLGERSIDPNRTPGQEQWRLDLDENGKVRRGGLLSGTASDRGVYERWRKGLEGIINLNRDTVENGANWTLRDTLSSDDVVLGYGSLEDLLNQQGITDASERSKIMQALQGRYLDLWHDYKNPVSSDFESGHLTKEAFQGSIGQILNLQNGHTGRTVLLPFGGGTIAGTSRYRGEDRSIKTNAIFLPRVADYMNPDQLLPGAIAFDIPSIYGGFGSVVNSLADAQVHRDDPNSNYREYMEESLLRFMGRMQADYQSKEGDAFRAANRIGVWHSMMGEATAPTIEQDEYWKELGDVATRVSLEDAEGLLRMQGESDPAQYLKALETQFKLLYSGLDDSTGINARLRRLYNPSKAQLDKGITELTQAQKISKLQKRLIDEVTGGTGAFERRRALAEARGAIFRGLSGATLRFPLSNGLDFRATDIFFDKSLSKNEIRGAFGPAFGLNTDFDGDKIAAWLTLASGEAIDGEDQEELIKQYKALSDSERRRAAIQAAFYRADLASSHPADINTNGEVSIKLSDLINKDAEEAGAILSRLNKSRTGLFSNNYQNITETLAGLSRHSDALGTATSADRRNFLSDIVARAVFEGFTQDAISSKKVSERIAKKYGKDWTDNSDFYTEVEALMARFKDNATYESVDTIKEALRTGVEMGIFGDLDDPDSVRKGTTFFNKRLMSLIVHQASEMDAADVAKVFGVSEGVAKGIQAEFDSKGKLKEYNFEALRDVLSLDSIARAMFDVNRRLQPLGGFAGVQWDSGARPGGINTMINAVGKLGQVSNAYDALRASAADAEKALSGEAAMEQRKIGIAGKEADAIRDGTQAYRERTTSLEDLSAALEDVGRVSTSVSTRLDRALGNHYSSNEDQTTFAKHLVAAYRRNPLGYIGYQGVTNMPGYTTERFRQLRSGLLSSTQGRMSDATDRLKSILQSDVGVIGLGKIGVLRDNIQNIKLQDIPDILKKLEENGSPEAKALASQLGAEFYSSQGVGILLGVGAEEDYKKYARNREGKELSEEELGALMETVGENADLYSALFGVRGGQLALENQQWMGELTNKFITHLANGAPVTREGGLLTNSLTKGRYDAMWRDPGSDVLNILDKKTVADLSSWYKNGVPVRYALQDLLYVQAAIETHNLLGKHPARTYKEWAASDEAKELGERLGVKISEQQYKDLQSGKLTSFMTHLTGVTDKGDLANFTAKWNFEDLDKIRRLTDALQGKGDMPADEMKELENWAARRFSINNAGFYDADIGNSPLSRYLLQQRGQRKGAGQGPLGALGGMLARMIGMRGPWLIFGALRKAFTGLIQDAQALDKTLTNLQITTGETREGARNLIAEYANLGKQIGATTQEVATSAIEWQRQGYDAAEVNDLVTSSMYLSKLGMMDAAAATSSLTSALKGFKLQASESMDVVDKLTAIDLKAATSAGEIATGLAQFANVGSLAGVTLDEAAAYVATIADVTQMGGSSAGQALDCFWGLIGIIHNPIGKIFSNDQHKILCCA